jgi:CHASE3 domain sensor protein
MSKLNEQDAPVEKEYTPEELKQMRERMMKSYKESIEVLKLQDEFEKLTANIAESQAKTMMNQIRMAQMAMGPPKETPDPEGDKKRKLKEE